MSSSKLVSDYPNVADPSRFHDITDENARNLKSFIVQSRLDGVSLNAINTNLWRVVSWMRSLNMADARSWSKDDIISVYLAKSDSVAAGRMASSTLNGELRALKKFLDVVRPGEKLVDIRLREEKVKRTSDDYISVNQILSMKEAALAEGDVRGCALIMGLLGTGCRCSEMLDANVGDLQIGRQYATLRVDGKTGERTIPFVTGLPELQNWVNHHPCRLNDGNVDPAAPLFVTYNTRGHGFKRLSRKTTEWMMNKYARAAGIPAPVKHNPHAFRHRCACVMSRTLTMKEMCLFFGWTDDSSMPALYCHTSEDELRRSVLQGSGVEVKEIAKVDAATQIQCPRCGSVCAANAKYCPQCSLVLDQALLKTYVDIQNDLGDPDIMQVLVDGKRNISPRI